MNGRREKGEHSKFNLLPFGATRRAQIGRREKVENTCRALAGRRELMADTGTHTEGEKACDWRHHYSGAHAEERKARRNACSKRTHADGQNSHIGEGLRDSWNVRG